ncbi:MAG TPA: DUF72 domain-containing protein [Methanocella sp.]
MILVGTSGWSYDDWAGAFYPPGLSKSEWLGYYAKFFSTTEINSTYYTFPASFVVQEWVRKASQLPGFEYSLKMPKKVTHDSLLTDLQTAQDFEAKVLAPLKTAGALGAVLVQASPGLQCPEHLDRLDTFLGAMDTKAYDYVVELRHRSWIAGDGTEPEAAALLRKHDVACCAVDGPSMPPVFENTGRHAYLRLHGRNNDVWFSKKKDLAGRMNRYDYVYSREELEPWRAKVASAGGKVRVYFNNHPHANAIRNAKLFEFMLGLAPEPALPPVKRQSGLSRFFE